MTEIISHIRSQAEQFLKNAHARSEDLAQSLNNARVQSEEFWAQLRNQSEIVIKQARNQSEEFINQAWERSVELQDQMQAQREELLRDIQRQQTELLEHVQQLEMEYNDRPYFSYGVVMICYLAISYICLLKFTKIERNRASWISYIPVYSLVAYVACAASYNLWNDRWDGVCTESKIFLVSYVSMQLFDISRQLIEDERNMSFYAMFLHHTISTISFGLGIFTHRMHFFGCFAGVCEISTVAISFAQAFKGFPMNAPLYYYNWLTTLSYFVFRIILFPIWMSVFLWDLITLEKWKTNSILELSLYPFAIIFLTYFSSMFMMKIWQVQMKLKKKYDENTEKTEAKKLD